jgi:hypothetical protein
MIKREGKQYFQKRQGSEKDQFLSETRYYSVEKKHRKSYAVAADF